MALNDRAKCVDALAELRVAESGELRLLASRALTAIGDPDEAVGWLVSDPRNLCLSPMANPHWTARELIQECSPGCSSELFERLESAVLEYSPDREREDYRGLSQYELLLALDATRMSPAAKSRLAELEQRFPDWEPQVLQPLIAQFVGSPISDDVADVMSDDDWLEALNTHTSKEPTWDGSGLVGGAGELARTLGARAKDEPERFSTLALRFSDEIPAAGMAQIINNVEASVNADTLADLCEHAHETYGAAVGQTVCSAIRHAGAANCRLIALIGAYAHDTNPDQETARTAAGIGQVFFDGDLFTAGLNSTRGQAALAAASVLFADTDQVDVLLPILEALVQDPILAVRVCAAEAIIALLRHRPSHALDLAEQLFDAPIDVLDARTSQRLLHYCLIRDPDRFTLVLAAALTDPGKVATRAGHIWAIERQQGRPPAGAPTDVSALATAARRGAAEAFASNVAESLDDLPQLLEDHDPDIRAQAGLAIRRLDEVSKADIEPLIDAVLASSTFPDQMENLIFAFERMQTQLPANTITVCERTVEAAGAELGNMASRAALTGHGLVTVVLRLYRQGDTVLRSRCLDIIDRLSESDVYFLEEALTDDR